MKLLLCNYEESRKTTKFYNETLIFSATIMGAGRINERKAQFTYRLESRLGCCNFYSLQEDPTGFNPEIYQLCPNNTVSCTFC